MKFALRQKFPQARYFSPTHYYSEIGVFWISLYIRQSFKKQGVTVSKLKSFSYFR